MTPAPLILAAFNSNPTAINGVTQLQALIGYAAWGATALCIIGLLVTGATMAIAHSRGGNEPMQRLGGVAAGCAIVGSAASVVGQVLGFSLFTATPAAIPGLTMVQNIIGWVAWVAAGGCLIGLIAAGAMMAVAFSQGRDHGSRLGGVMAGCLVVGSASTLVAAFI